MLHMQEVCDVAKETRSRALHFLSKQWPLYPWNIYYKFYAEKFICNYHNSPIICGFPSSERRDVLEVYFYYNIWVFNNDHITRVRLKMKV